MNFDSWNRVIESELKSKQPPPLHLVGSCILYMISSLCSPIKAQNPYMRQCDTSFIARLLKKGFTLTKASVHVLSLTWEQQITCRIAAYVGVGLKGTHNYNYKYSIKCMFFLVPSNLPLSFYMTSGTMVKYFTV